MATVNETATDESSTSKQVLVATAFGAVLALVGLLGPALAGPQGELVVFGRNYLHDGVHLLSGVAGIVAGYYAGGKYAAAYNKTLGAVYLLVTLAGFAFASLMADLLAVNAADNLLHLALAVVFLGVGFAFASAGDD